MTAKTAFAPAKINLTLHVTGQRDDGYHLLDSLVVFADVGDRLTLQEGPQMALEISGPFGSGVPTDPRNLVWQAAKQAGWTGHIHLKKNLPHGAGIGGGSADAAALLRQLFGDDVTQGIGLDAALALGADVPVCLHAGPQRMRGIGEHLSRALHVPPLHIVLVNPNVALPTPQVFKALTARENPAMDDLPQTREAPAFLDWLARQRNDLQPAATLVQPVITQVLRSLEGAQLARMSGSGATCFGIYADAQTARDAAAAIAAKHPDWWVTSAQTVGVS